MKKKPTKTQIRMLDLLMSAGGCVMTSEWVNGCGKYRTKRAVPVFSEDMFLENACELPGFAGRAARKVRKEHPRCQSVIIVTDIRAARRTLKPLREEEARRKALREEAARVRAEEDQMLADGRLRCQGCLSHRLARTREGVIRCRECHTEGRWLLHSGSESWALGGAS